MSGEYSRPGAGVLPSPHRDVDTPNVKNTSIDPLTGLVQRAARGDRQARASLYDSLAPEVLRTISRRLPDPVESMGVLRATFVEVWHLARFHTAAIPVRSWVVGIAACRAAERAGCSVVDRPPSWFGIIATHDAHSELEFSSLLNG